jgi:hypothetical protein
MKIKKIIGNIFIVFGILNIINFWAPRPIPTVGLSAILVGAFFIISGMILRIPDTSGKIRWDRLIRSKNSTKNEKKEKITFDPLLSVRVLKLASQKKGRLTVAQTAISLEIPIDQAEASLDDCVTRGIARIEIDPATGLTYYYFSEFIE